MNLKTSVSELKKVGSTTIRLLERLGIKTVGDLLYFFPFRYDDYQQNILIKDLKDGMNAVVRGRINLIAGRRSWKTKKTITEALIADASGAVRVIWFNQPYLIKTFKIGDEITLSGKVSMDMLGLQFISPSYEKSNLKDAGSASRLVPLYSLTGNITQKQIRGWMSEAMPLVSQFLEWLPVGILESEDLTPLSEAVRGLHFPTDEKDRDACLYRLKFDELFLLQLKVAVQRNLRRREKAIPLEFKENETKQFVKDLSFVLTKAQKVSAWEILRDLEKNIPMNRLLSGDVGSGKTVVAAMASYNAFLNGVQTAFMAPTEILAFQHFQSLQKMFGEKIVIGLFTRSQCTVNMKGEIKKKEILEMIANSEIQIIVGTHALLSEKVDFKNLGLVVVDEQHRFGVEQRKIMKEKMGKKVSPHFLSMTATPIPRSLALTIYGDLDLSIINEMPVGRKSIITRLVDPINRLKAYEFIKKQIIGGRQVFVVCPLIENLNPGSDKKSVLSEYEKLSTKIFPNFKVGYLHGKMKGKEKEAIMAKFKNKELDILISTAVIEVGVDIPNASVMLIEGSDRFGLAQLHQFRGRVGRSIFQSYCFLFTDNTSVETTERLKFFEKNLDGFKLAEHDLEKRGPGEVYGVEQSGYDDLKLAKLTDREMIKVTREWANKIAPEIKKYPLVKEKIGQNYKVHWE